VAPVAAGKVPLIVFAISLPLSTATQVECPSCFSWMLTMLAVYTGAGKIVSCSKDTYRTDVCMTKLMIATEINSFPYIEL